MVVIMQVIQNLTKNIIVTNPKDNVGKDYRKTVEQKTSFNNDFHNIASNTADCLRGYLGITPQIIKKVSQAITQSNIDEKARQKVNEIKLTKMFLDSGFSLQDISKNKELIKKLSRLDYTNVEGKFKYYQDNLAKLSVQSVRLSNIAIFLEIEELTPEMLKSLHEMAKLKYKEDSVWNGAQTPSDIWETIYFGLKSIREYDEFDFMTTANQVNFIRYFKHNFCENYINSLNENDPLLKLNLINDIKRCGSNAALQSELKARMKNQPVKFIECSQDSLSHFVESDTFCFENLQNTIGNLDLSKYEKGLPLKYSRDSFIQDFNSAIKDLNPNDRRQVFDYFQFRIDNENDIVKFPVPNDSDISEFNPNVQSAINKTRVYVNDFITNNEFVLNKEDKVAEEVLNEFIRVFPEFISVVGKIQHRGDSIDKHTLEDIQLCLKNPETKTLSKEEFRILFLSVMFHDIAKRQKMVDEGHAKPSAYFAKELVKKLPINSDEKKRIYNIIINSHWVTDGTDAKDLAASYRYFNDFKIAQIIAKADAESAGFTYAANESTVDEINSNIEFIRKNGIPIFADNLPVDKSKFPQDAEGVKYLDFSDPDKDLSEFGFAQGTKVKDLNFLCHSSHGTLNELSAICDDSKEICLSSSLLNVNYGLSTNYNSGVSVILHSSNSDIALAGKKVGCTGGQRGRDAFETYIFMQGKNESEAKRNKNFRTELPNFIKKELNLTDEEYYEFFDLIDKFDKKECLKDIKLKSGRIISAEETARALDNMHQYMLAAQNKGDYINEVVVFQPKIEAVVMSKKDFINSSIKDNQIKQTAKENNIPIILV